MKPEPIQKLSLRFQVGRYADYGLEEPAEPVTRSHPTLNSELLYKIRHGKVHTQRGVEKVEGKRVFFKDGREGEYDTIVAATGYKITFPFFNDAIVNYEEADRIPLYLRMFHQEQPTLIFIGLFQPQFEDQPQAKQTDDRYRYFSCPDRAAENELANTCYPTNY